MTATNPRSVPVLIAGGGSVGLTAAVLLARHGVRSLVAERHPGTSILPRAFGSNVRTMEIFRGLGLEEAIQAVEVDVAPCWCGPTATSPSEQRKGCNDMPAELNRVIDTVLYTRRRPGGLVQERL